MLAIFLQPTTTVTVQSNKFMLSILSILFKISLMFRSCYKSDLVLKVPSFKQLFMSIIFYIYSIRNSIQMNGQKRLTISRLYSTNIRSNSKNNFSQTLLLIETLPTYVSCFCINQCSVTGHTISFDIS